MYRSTTIHFEREIIGLSLARNNMWLCAMASRGFVIRDSVVCTVRSSMRNQTVMMMARVELTLIHTRLLCANCLSRISCNFTHASTSSCLAYAAKHVWDFGSLMATSICSIFWMGKNSWGAPQSSNARMFDIYSTQIGLLTSSISWRFQLIGMSVVDWDWVELNNLNQSTSQPINPF